MYRPIGDLNQLCVDQWDESATTTPALGGVCVLSGCLAGCVTLCGKNSKVNKSMLTSGSGKNRIPARLVLFQGLSYLLFHLHFKKVAERAKLQHWYSVHLRKSLSFYFAPVKLCVCCAAAVWITIVEHLDLHSLQSNPSDSDTCCFSQKLLLPKSNCCFSRKIAAFMERYNLGSVVPPNIIVASVKYLSFQWWTRLTWSQCRREGRGWISSSLIFSSSTLSTSTSNY